MTRTEIEGNTVSTRFGLWPIGYTSNTVYRPGLGCARLEDGTLADIEGPKFLARDMPQEPLQDLAWPDLVADPEGVDTAALQAALDRAFFYCNSN